MKSITTLVICLAALCACQEQPKGPVVNKATKTESSKSMAGSLEENKLPPVPARPIYITSKQIDALNKATLAKAGVTAEEKAEMVAGPDGMTREQIYAFHHKARAGVGVKVGEKAEMVAGPVGMTAKQIKAFNKKMHAGVGMKVGEKAEIEAGSLLPIERGGDAIEFVKIKEDSRCPAGAQCAWAGEVKVEINVISEGKSESLTLGAEPITWNTYQLIMKDVLIYPSVNKQPPQLPKLVLQIEKTGAEVKATSPSRATPATKTPPKS